MAAPSRYRTLSNVRRVFVRHWIDVDRLNIGCHRGTVRVTGELHVLRQQPSTTHLSIVEVIRGELVRIRDVQRVELDLSNWVKSNDGRWTPKRGNNRDDDVKHSRVAVKEKEPQEG